MAEQQKNSQASQPYPAEQPINTTEYFLRMAGLPRDGLGPEINPHANPHFGKEIEILSTNFTVTTQDRLKAASGAPAWSRRTKALDDRLEKLWQGLEEEYQRLQGQSLARAEFSRRWRGTVDSIPLDEIARQVSDYNEYFPIEANLPIDPATGQFRMMSSLFEPRKAPTRDEILRRFPL